MRVFFLSLVLVLPGTAAAATILANTPDSNTSHFAGCYSTNPNCNLVFPNNNVNNKSSWLAIGWTMGANAYPFLSADVIQTQLGFAPSNGAAFTTGLWSDSGGVPGALIASLTPSPSSVHASYVAVTFTSSTPITLQANTTYWLVMTGLYPTFWLAPGATPFTSSGASYLGLLQSTSTAASNAPIGANPGAPLLSSPGLQPYFVLSADTGPASTPEPGTIAIGVGLALLAVLRSRAER